MQISNSSPAPESNSSSSDVNTDVNASVSTSTSTPTESKVTKVTGSKPTMTRDQIAERASKLNEKAARGEEFSDEDVEFFDTWQSHELQKAAEERNRFNGTVPQNELENANTEETPEEAEATDETNPEEKTQDTDSYQIPEDHADIYKMTGAKNPQELIKIHNRNLDRLEQAMEWKTRTEAKIQETTVAHEKQLNNAVELLEAVVLGNPDAIEAAKELLIQAGRSANAPMELKKENFLSEADYEHAVRMQNELAALKNKDAMREQEERKRNAEVQSAKLKHEILTEVSSFAENAKDLGLTPAQARAVFNALEENPKANLPAVASKFKAVYDIAVEKNLRFEDAYHIYRGKNLATIIKEEVAKYTNPKMKPSVGLSGVTPKAPANPGGRFTRADVQKMIDTDTYPPEWTVTLSNGTKQLNPKRGAIPDYVSAIIEDLLG